MTEDLFEGQLKGIGLRPDPKQILIAPHEKDGALWGYTIIDTESVPTMYIKGAWEPVVPEAVWIQMIDNWKDISKDAKDLFAESPEYLDYPELRKLIGEDD